MSLVTLNGQSLDEVEMVYDGDGLAWCVTELVGWESGSGAEVEKVQRGGADGAVVSTARLVGRELTVKGVVQATSDAALAKARTRLPGIFNIVRFPGLLVVNDAEPKQAEVYRDGPLSVSHVGWTLRYEADLFSPDWRRFGTETALDLTIPAGSLSRQLSTTNAGNVESHPRITITGPAVNPRVADMTTGDELDLGVTLQGTDTLVIDMLDQAVTLNGAPADNLVTGGEWWTLLPGSHSLRYRVTQTSAGDSTATVTARSAYA